MISRTVKVTLPLFSPPWVSIVRRPVSSSLILSNAEIWKMLFYFWIWPMIRLLKELLHHELPWLVIALLVLRFYVVSSRWVPGLSMWKARFGYLDRYEFLCRSFAWDFRRSWRGENCLFEWSFEIFARSPVVAVSPVICTLIWPQSTSEPVE